MFEWITAGIVDYTRIPRMALQQEKLGLYSGSSECVHQTGQRDRRAPAAMHRVYKQDLQARLPGRELNLLRGPGWRQGVAAIIWACKKRPNLDAIEISQ